MATIEHPTFAPLVDMSNERLTAILAAGTSDTALARSVKRLMAQLDDPNGVISAFSSFVE